MKQMLMTVLGCLLLQVVACGREKKPVTNQPQEHDPVKGMTQGINYGNIDKTKWDDENNRYTTLCTKNFRFDLEDSSKLTNSRLRSIYFLDDKAIKISQINLDYFAWLGIKTNTKIVFSNEDVLNEDTPDFYTFKLKNIGDDNIKKIVGNAKTSTKITPNFVKLYQPEVFTWNEKLIICTQIEFYQNYNLEEETVAIGGKTYIEGFNKRGEQIFSYWDENTSNRGLKLNDGYLIQNYGYHSIEGDNDKKPGVKIYDLNQFKKIIDYQIGNDEDVRYDINLFYQKNSLVGVISRDDDRFEIIILDYTKQEVLRKEYFNKQEVTNYRIELIEDKVYFKFRNTNQISHYKNISEFNKIEIK